MADAKELAKLSNQELEELLLKVEIEKAKANEKAFESLELIPSQEGHKHDFEKLKLIAETYKCKDLKCELMAYHCPNCGFVPGLPRQEKYKEGSSLSRIMGFKSSCNICKVELGKIEIGRS